MARLQQRTIIVVRCAVCEGNVAWGRMPWRGVTDHGSDGLKNLIAWSLYLQGFLSCESPRKTREQGGKGV
eukprot:6701510-Ditylum_brightwellii.AAC.1